MVLFIRGVSLMENDNIIRKKYQSQDRYMSKRAIVQFYKKLAEKGKFIENGAAWQRLRKLEMDYYYSTKRTRLPQ